MYLQWTSRKAFWDMRQKERKEFAQTMLRESYGRTVEIYAKRKSDERKLYESMRPTILPISAGQRGVKRPSPRQNATPVQGNTKCEGNNGEVCNRVQKSGACQNQMNRILLFIYRYSRCLFYDCSRKKDMKNEFFISTFSFSTVIENQTYFHIWTRH